MCWIVMFSTIGGCFVYVCLDIVNDQKNQRGKGASQKCDLCTAASGKNSHLLEICYASTLPWPPELPLGALVLYIWLVWDFKKPLIDLREIYPVISWQQHSITVGALTLWKLDTLVPWKHSTFSTPFTSQDALHGIGIGLFVEMPSPALPQYLCPPFRRCLSFQQWPPPSRLMTCTTTKSDVNHGNCINISIGRNCL